MIGDLSVLRRRLLVEPMELPMYCQLAHLVGQTSDNERAVLQWAAKHRKKFGGRYTIIGSPGGYGWPGYDAWFNSLRRRGVPAERITAVPGPDRVNTLSEMSALVRFAREQRIDRLLIVAPHFHIMRAYMTAVSVALRECRTLQVFPALGILLPWNEVVHHSQGELIGPRWQLAIEETARIYEYCAKGDLVPPANILAYMDELGI